MDAITPERALEAVATERDAELNGREIEELLVEPARELLQNALLRESRLEIQQRNAECDRSKCLNASG